jgi:biotin carboxyl carrier protein
MELEDLKQLIELLKETDITEFQVEKEGTKVKIKREKFFPSLEIATQKTPSLQEAAIKRKSRRRPNGSLPLRHRLSEHSTGLLPQALFLLKQDCGLKGQVLCIIEAMKLMNEIEAMLTAF